MEKPPRRLTRIIFLVIILLLTMILALVLLVLRPLLLSQSGNSAIPFSTAQPSEPILAITIEPTQPQPTELLAFPTLPVNPASAEEGLAHEGIFILSLADGNHDHLFMVHPLYQQLTRLTDGAWDDIDPSIGPDGSRMAFSSNRNGYWDIYLLDLSSGQVTRLTDTPEYDASPTWSPDGQWIAYETLVDGNLEIEIKAANDAAASPIRLTNDPASDRSPVWSPQGRELAFVSDRSGDEEIWTARLDIADDRFQNVSRGPGRRDQHPAWSPDGNFLAWASDTTLVIRDVRTPERAPVPVGQGDHPIWNPRGDLLLTSLQTADSTSLVVYTLPDGELAFPILRMPGSLSGITWQAGVTPRLLRALPPLPDASVPHAPLWTPSLSTNPQPPAGRFGVVPLPDITASFPYLHDAVDESFNELRKEVAHKAGWDFLANLESAYLPFNEPPAPYMEPNWLYTGRAITVNPLPLNAGWMALVREEFAGQTYWRIYIKARYQDGSQGKPITDQIWDMNARFIGNPQDYETGGRFGAIPSGYWIDFTEIAHRYRWERIPAAVNWRTYFQGTHFNLYLLNDGLDWNTAMAEIYPPEALVTPTFRPTFTPTVTQTPEFFEWFTLTPTPLPTLSPTLRPTYTPQP